MWKSPHGRRLPELGKRVVVMGILNVTRDSFSDGGKYFEASDALKRALEMAEDGAEIVDVGAESTRPGAEELPLEREMDVLVSRIRLLRENMDIPISADTYKPEAALAAVEAGADIINDVYAKVVDGGYPMARVAAKTGAGLIITHDCRGREIEGKDFWGQLEKSLEELANMAMLEGVEKSQIVLDPGMGFGKSAEQNFEIVRRAGELRKLGFPVLLGASRKSFLRGIVGGNLENLDAATAAVSAFVAAKFGADILRVHNVAENAAAVKIGTLLGS